MKTIYFFGSMADIQRQHNNFLEAHPDCVRHEMVYKQSGESMVGVLSYEERVDAEN